MTYELGKPGALVFLQVLAAPAVMAEQLAGAGKATLTSANCLTVLIAIGLS